MEKILQLLKTKFSYDNKQFCFMFIFLGFLLSFVCVLFAPADEIGNEKYPLANDFLQREQYKLQFAAFLDGHIHLDAVPAEALGELENPYDPDERENADLHSYFTKKENSYLWDVAYYEGQYFSYFGIAPIITVYYPYYILTGNIISHFTACLILSIFACMFLMLAYRETVFLFTDGALLLPTLVGGIALFFASGMLSALSYSDNYYLAVISAICFSTASVFFGLFALRRKKIYAKCIFLALCAICLTLTVWSRPSSAIMCLFLVCPFFKYLSDALAEFKRNAEKKYAPFFPCAAFLVTLALGAFAVMYYNFVRFDSPLEFGARYQLTVSDISQNTLNVSLLCESIFAYFLQNPEMMADSVFLPAPSVRFFTSANRFIYCSENVGCLWFGLPLGIPFSFEKKIFKNNKKAFFAAIFVLVCAFCIAFVNFCVAGVNMRYLLDILPMTCLIGTASLAASVSDSDGRKRSFVGIFLLAVCLMAVVCGFGCAVFFSKAAGQVTL